MERRFTRPQPKKTEDKTPEQEPVSDLELELKFLVDIDQLPDLEGVTYSDLRQGYLEITDTREDRIREKRAADGAAKYIHEIKEDIGAGDGTERRETAVPGFDAAAFEELWPQTEGRRIVKRRYEIPHTYTDVRTGESVTVTIELDHYQGVNGVEWTAEVEFEAVGGRSAADMAAGFEPPVWFAQNITTDKRYKNKNLALNGGLAAAY